MIIECSQDEYDDIAQDAAGEVPVYTCPEIDQAISQVKDALKTASNAHRNYESVTDLADQIDRDLWNIDSRLEDLRKANDKLRTAAKYWKDVFERNVAILPQGGRDGE